MNKYRILFLGGLVAMMMLAMISCSDSRRLEEARHIVINELMPSNRTGLITEEGKTADWVELKNTSKDTIDLKGFELAVVKKKLKKDNGRKIFPEDEDLDDMEEVSENETKDDEHEEVEKTWEFPSVKIAGGECLVVFFDKKKKEKDAKEDKNSKKEGDIPVPGEIIADLKLPKKGATLQLRAPGGKVVREVKYGHLAPDQSLAMQPDSTYFVTNWPSPGFENDDNGYEKASEKMDLQRKGALKIWEVMSREEHSYDNWVELKNTGNKDIDLSAYRLQRRMGKDKGWTLPKRIIKPGEIVKIKLAGRRANPGVNSQADIKIGNAETIVLTRNGKFEDGASAKLTPQGGSIGRAEGKKGFFYYAKATPGEENGNEGKRFIVAMPEFDLKPGPYAKKDKLVLRLKDKKQSVRYTLDGSAPTSTSPVFKDSLLITKNTIVRTFAEGDSTRLRSRTATSTYLPGAEHTIPVVSIVVNNGDLYNFANGIYAQGPGFDEEFPHMGANYWKPWTKDAHAELFDEGEGFSTDCGLKIFGGFSRALEKKSFTLKFKGKYGAKEVEYDFFGDKEPMELEDLVLRSGSQDYMRCMLRDEFFTSLMGANSPTLLTQKYRPVALYINGDYFGLYYLREKIDKHFVSRKLNVPTDSVTIVMSHSYVEEGDPNAFKQFKNFISTHDMSVPANYEYVKKNMDLQSLIDYKIGEMYAGNADVGNVRYVRSTAPGSDRKWYHVYYDLDATWTGEKPTPEFYLSMTGSASEGGAVPHNLIINKLLNNKEFRALFLERLSYHLANTFSEKNATAVFDKLVVQISPEMKLNCQRWPQLSYEKWESNIKEFRAQFAVKPKKMLDGVREYLRVSEAENKKYFSNF